MDVEYVVSSVFSVAVMLIGLALGIFNFIGIACGITAGQIFILLWPDYRDSRRKRLSPTEKQYRTIKKDIEASYRADAKKSRVGPVIFMIDDHFMPTDFPAK